MQADLNFHRSHLSKGKFSDLPGSIVQSVPHLTADPGWGGGGGVPVQTPGHITFLEIDHEIIFLFIYQLDLTLMG